MGAETRRIIMVVDDEPDIVKTLNKRLEIAGYQVTIANDGQDAVSKVQGTRPDLIILDVMLPKMNGYEVCAKLKQDPAYKRIPIVMFTAKGQSQEHLAGLMFGADAYVSKSCQYDVLLEQIKALLPESSSTTPSHPR